MQPDDVTAVQCPCCKKQLYRYVVKKDGVVGTLKGDPKIQLDELGHYMECDHCRKRIAFEVVPGGPFGQSFQLSQRQKCV
jgi:hypothetical protein